MKTLSELAEFDSDDSELIPEILPVDARLSVKGNTITLIELFQRAASVTPVKEVIAGTLYALLEAVPLTAVHVPYVRVTATDGDQTVSVVTDSLTINMAGSVLVPAKRMLDILKLAPEDTVRIDVLGSSATIISGRARWTVQTPTGDALPPTPSVDHIELTPVLRREFRDALKVARVAAGNGSGRGRPALAQLLIRNGQVTACDGARLHRQRIEGFDTKIEMSIPSKVVDEVIRALNSSEEEFVDVGVDDYHIVFKVGRDTLIAQRLLVPFPDVEALILGPAFSNEHTLTIIPSELSAAIKRVRVNANPDHAGIFLSLVKGGVDGNGEPVEWSLAVSAADRTGNTSQEMIECEWTGPQKGRELCVNHRYLSELVDSFPMGKALIEFKIGEDLKGSRSPLFVEDSEDGLTAFIQQMNPAWVRS